MTSFLICTLVLLFSGLESVAAVSASPSGGLITRVVGEVSDRIVTSREVQINDALEKALDAPVKNATGVGSARFKILTGREPAFAISVSRALSEWAVFLESKAFAERAPPKAEAQKQTKLAFEFWAGRPEFARLEADEAEVRDMMERKLVAREFLRIKSEASQAPITDADAMSYFRRNRLKFGNLPFEDFRDNIKAFLAKQQSERRLKEWLEVLERKYKTRNFVSG